jgi:rhamnopyranosyl-N-acetylglucosaminyl-diphospho-decaprenol beta-1,3/1,4-galactofuranosyltransferase
LISSTVPQSIGLPIKEMFIWGDEVEYIERAKRGKFTPVLVTNSIHYHPLDRTKRIPVFWGRAHISVPDSSRRLYILLRNQSYIWTRYSFGRLILMASKYLTYAMTKRDMRVLRILVVALKDGIAGLWGNETRYAE